MAKVAQHFKKKEIKFDAADLYEARSESEIERDAQEFQLNLQEINLKNKKVKRRTESFDEEFLRDPYRDFGVASDFESQESWISYPPRQSKFLKEADVVAKINLFSEKIKSKF